MPSGNKGSKSKQAARRDTGGSNSDRSRSGRETVPAMMSVVGAGSSNNKNAANSNNALELMDIDHAQSDVSTPPRTLAVQTADRAAFTQQQATQQVPSGACAGGTPDAPSSAPRSFAPQLHQHNQQNVHVDRRTFNSLDMQQNILVQNDPALIERAMQAEHAAVASSQAAAAAIAEAQTVAAHAQAHVSQAHAQANSIQAEAQHHITSAAAQVNSIRQEAEQQVNAANQQAQHASACAGAVTQQLHDASCEAQRERIRANIAEERLRRLESEFMAMRNAMHNSASSASTADTRTGQNPTDQEHLKNLGSAQGSKVEHYDLSAGDPSADDADISSIDKGQGSSSACADGPPKTPSRTLGYEPPEKLRGKPKLSPIAQSPEDRKLIHDLKNSVSALAQQVAELSKKQKIPSFPIPNQSAPETQSPGARAGDKGEPSPSKTSSRSSHRKKKRRGDDYSSDDSSASEHFTSCSEEPEYYEEGEEEEGWPDDDDAHYQDEVQGDVCEFCGGPHATKDCGLMRTAKQHLFSTKGGTPTAHSEPSTPQFNKYSKTLNTVFIGNETEEDVMRVRDIKDLKLPQAPKDAFGMRSYINTITTTVSALDKTERDVLTEWIMHPFEGGHGPDFQRSLADSQGLIRLDRQLAQILGTMSRYEAGSDVAREIQEYLEKCRADKRGARGRVMLNIIASEFVTDKSRGLTLISRALLNCKLGGYSKEQLNQWIHAVNTIIFAIKKKDLPDDNTLFEWCFDQLRNCTRLKEEVKKVRNAAEGSHRRKWTYLFDKLKLKLREEKHDANQTALQAGFDKIAQGKGAATPKPKPKPKVGGAAGTAAPGKGKGKDGGKGGGGKAPGLVATPKPKAKAKAKAKGKAKAGGKGAGTAPAPTAPPAVRIKPGATRPTKQDGTYLKLRDMTPAQKKVVMCAFHPGSCSKGDQCEFFHDPSLANNKEEIAKAKANAANRAAKAKVPGAAAAIAGAAAIPGGKGEEVFPDAGPGACAGAADDTPKTSVTKNFGQKVKAFISKVVPMRTIKAMAAAPILSSNVFKIEALGDTGAGRNMGSEAALIAQGIPQDLVQSAVRESSQPIIFETGGGNIDADNTICLKSLRGKVGMDNTYMLPESPLALSVGTQVLEKNKPFVWLPSEGKPFFADKEENLKVTCASKNRTYAKRIEENVPIFEILTRIAPGAAGKIANQSDPPTSDTAVGGEDPGIAGKTMSAAHADCLPGDEVAADGRPLSGGSSGSSSSLNPDAEQSPATAVEDAAATSESSAAGDGDTAAAEDLESKPGMSNHHSLTHFPKDPSCAICNQCKIKASPARRQTVEQKLKKLATATAPMQHILGDMLVLTQPEGPDPTLPVQGACASSGSKSSKASLRPVVHAPAAFVCVDLYSDAESIIPLKNHSSKQIEAAIRDFQGGLCDKTFRHLSSDAQPAIAAACNAIGLINDKSLPHRRVHNARCERRILELQESARCSLYQSGLPLDFTDEALEYTGRIRNFTLLSPCASAEDSRFGKTRYEVLHNQPFGGFLIPFGALVFYRPYDPKESLHTLSARTRPGIFLGYETSPGCLWKGGYRILDYTSLIPIPGENASESASRIRRVIVKEICFGDGNWKFPLAVARDTGISKFSQAALASPEDVGKEAIESPQDALEISGPKSKIGERKTVYITLERRLRYGRTDGCGGCHHGLWTHSARCKERFTKLIDAEKQGRVGLAVLPEAPVPPVPPPPTPASSDIADAGPASEEAAVDAALTVLGACAGTKHKNTFCEECMERIPAKAMCCTICKPSAKARVPAAAVKVKEMPIPPEPHSIVWKFADDPTLEESETNLTTKGEVGLRYINFDMQEHLLEVEHDGTPHVKAMVAKARTLVQELACQGGPAASIAGLPNKVNRHSAKQIGHGHLFEFCCDKESSLGKCSDKYGIHHARLSLEAGDCSDDAYVDGLIAQATSLPGSDLWGSIPCTAWSTWQHMALALYGKKYWYKLLRKRRHSRKILANYLRLAEVIISNGGRVAFEWPRRASGWHLPELQEFIRKHGLYVCDFDGCSFGMNIEGSPVRKMWRVITNDSRLACSLNKHRCTCRPGTHATIAGSVTSKTAFYPAAMCETIISSLYPDKVHGTVPAMPTRPIVLHPHREQELPRVDFCDIPSQQPVGVVFDSACAEGDTDRSTRGSDSACAGSSVVAGMVTRLLSRKEMMGSEKALAAVAKEARGLEDKGTWDNSTVVERDHLISSARENSTPLHIGKLMSICSEKFAELDEDQRVLKGRVVYRGDDTRDEYGAMAVFQDLQSNPASIQSANCTIAYGRLKGNKTTSADAVKAYVQANLKSKRDTWIELPPELRPKSWGGKYRRPMVKLIKALYGHPESGAHWENHLTSVLNKLGGKVIPEMPSAFYFKETGLLLTVYVDDFLLSGPEHAHAPFWAELEKHVEIEGVAGLERFLGRHHELMPLPKEFSACADSEGTATEAVAFDMRMYVRSACQLYEDLSGKTLKGAPTPFLPDSSLPACDDDITGQLAGDACKILMKNLWVARLARPDLLRPITALASKVTKWSVNCDRMLHRLMQYMHRSADYLMLGWANDAPDDVYLELFVDANFAGDKEDAKSTSGGWLVLKGPNTCFPLAWVSRKQTSTARSTTESEVIALAHSLFQEALPIHALFRTVLGRDLVLKIREDNQATIKVVQKGYSAKLRHIGRVHKVDLSSIKEEIDKDDVELSYVITTEQCADMFTKPLEPQKWSPALVMCNIVEYPRSDEKTSESEGT